MSASTSTSPKPSPIAIVGVSALFPGSSEKQAFWRHIVDGRDFISDVPADHWLIEDYFDPDPTKQGKVYTRRGAFLPHVPFNPMEFGLPPNNLPSTDTVQLLALLGTKQLLGETKSVRAEKVSRKAISVILGLAAGTELIGSMAAKIQRPHWVEGMRRAGVSESQVQAACDAIAATYPDWNESTFPGLLANVAAGRIANRFDLGGANCVIDAACASSLAALTLAVDELRLGKSDLVITGGCDALNDIFMFTCFTRTPAMSRSGDCRPFSDTADGTLLGEGIGLFALRRLEDAERDGDAIYAVISGVGSSSDGSAKSVYAPRAEGQAEAIRRALAEAGATPDQIGLIEAHGTATKAGDAAEVGGLKQAFASATRPDRHWCALGSIKSQIGHTKSAAGAAGLFKTVMALRHKVLPPTIKVDRPNPALELENSPFYLNTEARPWIQAPGETRRAGLSSFGFGGSNFHVVLEEYRGRNVPPRIATAKTHLFLFGAASIGALLDGVRDTTRRLGNGSPLAGLARETLSAFSPSSPHRLGLLATSVEDFATLQTIAVETLPNAGETSVRNGRLHYSRETPASPASVSFLFPGQGSQYVGMGAGLAMEFEPARSVWDRAATTAPAGRPSWNELVFPRSVFSEELRAAQEAELTQTQNAQPALGLASLAALKTLELAGVGPAFVGGHSYGELVALFAARAIPDEQTLLSLSAARGNLMAQASAEAPGTMLAVIGPVAEIDALVAAVGQGLTVANRNSPQQVVVSGPHAAVSALELRLAADKRWTTVRVPVSAAFHSPLVAGAAVAFADQLAAAPLRSPAIPVFANTTGRAYPSDAAEIRSMLARQLASPVLFDAQVEAMYAAGARVFLDVGPRSALTRLVAQILANRPHAAIGLDQKGGDGLSSFFEGLARLSVLGLPVDYAALLSDFEAPAIDPSAAPPARGVVMINGANVGKPYPPANGAAGRTPPVSPPAVPSPTETSSPHSSDRAAVPMIPPAALPSSTPAAMSASHEHANDAGSRYALLEQIQRNVLEAQRHFQDTLAQSHLAFLQTSEALLRQIGQGGATGVNGASAPILPTLHAPVAPRAVAPTSPSQNGVHAHPAPITTTPHVAPAPAARTLPRPPTHDFSPIVTSPTKSRVEQPAPAPGRETHFEIPAPAAAPAPASAPAAVDYREVILSTIASCTGYPVDMIELDMELEAGLGIDSIKKVEIFSELQGKIPELAQAEAGKVATLSTVRAILDFTVALTGGAAAGQKKK